MRIGSGYDLHRLVPGRPLVIGGVRIPAPFGEDGHSDGDVLIHALIDALLGAAAMGDIGTHFPPSDPAYRGIDSRRLLAATAAMITDAGYRVANIDSTVLLETPKLKEHITAIRLSGGGSGSFYQRCQRQSQDQRDGGRGWREQSGCGAGDGSAA